MNRSDSRSTRLLLEGRAKALKHHLPKAIDGDGIGVHHARVASRRLRELVPVLSEDVKGNKPRKAERKIRRLTRALGAVRELDVTLTALDELAARDTLPRDALEDVRAHVVAEREELGHSDHRRAGRAQPAPAGPFHSPRPLPEPGAAAEHTEPGSAERPDSLVGSSST